jgi:hypothetical protein
LAGAAALVPKPQFTGDKLADLFVAWDRASGPLYKKFEQATKAVDENPNLTDVGKQAARKALVAEFRDGDIRRHRGSVEKGRARIAELLAQLTKPRIPDVSKMSVFEQVDLANQRDRTIPRYTSLEPSARRAAFNAALQTKNTDLLGALLNEPALLSEADAKRATAIIVETADPQTFRELTELAGELDLVSGEFNPQSSAFEVASFAVDQLLERADEWAGL